MLLSRSSSKINYFRNGDTRLLPVRVFECRETLCSSLCSSADGDWGKINKTKMHRERILEKNGLVADGTV